MFWSCGSAMTDALFGTHTQKMPVRLHVAGHCNESGLVDLEISVPEDLSCFSRRTQNRKREHPLRAQAL